VVDLLDVVVPGGRVGVALTGAADGPLVLALPGLSDGVVPLHAPGAEQRVPGPPPALDGLRFALLSYRDPLAAGTTTAMLADDVPAVLDALRAERAHVLGHSTGGMVATHLAARHPGRVASVCASATPLVAGPVLRGWLDRWDALVRAGDLVGQLADATRASLPEDDRDDRLALLAAAPPTPVHDAVARHLALSAAVAGHDASRAAREVRAPTLVVVGARDRVCPPAGARALADAVPDAGFETWPDVGHGLPDVAYPRLAASVRALVELVEG